jgi:hypothetical protein
MRGEIPYSCFHTGEIKKAGPKAKAFFIISVNQALAWKKAFAFRLKLLSQAFLHKFLW